MEDHNRPCALHPQQANTDYLCPASCLQRRLPSPFHGSITTFLHRMHASDWTPPWPLATLPIPTRPPPPSPANRFFPQRPPPTPSNSSRGCPGLLSRAILIKILGSASRFCSSPLSEFPWFLGLLTGNATGVTGGQMQ
jgi:hypothetical protein